MKSTTTSKKIIFIIAFAVFGFIALQIPFNNIIGSKVSFTLFDFFGPIAGGFIGAIPGIISVLIMQAINFFAHGAEVVDAGTIIRFFPMLFAVLYFSRKSKLNLILPIVAIVAFVIHPIGRQVWLYPMFWIIPIACYFLREKSLVAKSLGTTFTAHAVGSTLWLYVFNLPVEVWISLIPIVIMERAMFTFGIAGTYVVTNNVLKFLVERKIVSANFLVDQKYAWKWIK